MPTYEFRCQRGHEFDRFYKTMSAAPSELTCPDCGGVALRQLSGGAGLLFKGSGFYLTDYGKNAHRKPEGDKAGAAKGETAGEAGKAESSKTAPAKAEAATGEAGKSSSSTSKSEATKADKSKRPSKKSP
jgi:putative FmdB family regulatory protein